MRRADFAEAYQEQVRSEIRFTKRLIWACVIGFGLPMGLGLLLPLAHRWIAIYLAVLLLGLLLIVSAKRNARADKQTTLRCSSCAAPLPRPHSDLAMSSGVCPHCKRTAFETD